MSLAAFVFFNGLLLVAAVYDLRSFRIPNQLSLVLAAAAVPLSPPASAEEAIGRLATVTIIGLVALGLYLKNALGGGDVKLLAACGLWIPLSGLPTFATALGLAGGLQAHLEGVLPDALNIEDGRAGREPAGVLGARAAGHERPEKPADHRVIRDDDAAPRRNWRVELAAVCKCGQGERRPAADGGVLRYTHERASQKAA